MSRPNPFKCFNAAYLIRILVATLLALGLGVLSRAMGLEKGVPLRIAFAAGQAALFAYAITITVLATRKLDELQHRIHLEAIAISFAATGSIITGWGLLSKAGLPPMPWSYVWPVMVFFWFVGLLHTRRRYQ